jgi:stage II sporulation protein D
LRLPATLVLVLALAAATAGAQPAPPATAPGEALFVLSGRGYGHGVGMSQYGAYGMAREGASYTAILAHYYTGTTVGRVPAREVRVLLGQGRRAVTVASPAPFTVVDAAGRTYRQPPGALVLRPGLVVPAAAGPAEAAAPLVVRPGKGAPLALDGRPYRGRLEIVPERGFLRIVNHVALEAYLQGVVPGEVPHGWPAEVLKAQAVAARSYALATLVKGRPFDLYADVRSQVYLGVAGERESTTQAIRATRGQVVLYGGKVATTYYFSTSGGRTANVEDVFGAPVPYLVSRPDPADRASPYHSWGPVLLGARTLQARLGIEGRVLDMTGAATPSGRLKSLVIRTPSGTTTVPAAVLRTALGLRSTWVTIGVLRLDQPRAPVLFGESTRLDGIARGVQAPTLASSVTGAQWSLVAGVGRAGGGVFSVPVKPQRTMRYRIEVKGAASPATLVRVSPRVQLTLSEEPGVLTGTVRPRLPSVEVSVERRAGTSWVPVATVSTDERGVFRVELDAVRGSYRARVPATAGFAEAVGPVLTVGP